MATVYILKCKNGDYYIEITNNLKRRLTDHQQGKSKATKGKLPVKLVYQRGFKTLKEARKFEYFLKKQRNREFFKKVIKNEIVWPRRLVV